EKGITMTEEDLRHESNLVKSNLAAQQGDLRTKICSPLIQSGELLGVVNIGHIAVRDDIGVRMAKMIVSLASIALGNLLLKEEIKVVADRDGLTGLFSLQHFLAELPKELGKARRYKRPFAICHFNIDNFARYNEKNGYLAGDEVLRMMSKILKDHLREHDMVARFSGKEFVILCPETQQEDAMRLARKLAAIIHEAPFPHKGTMPGGLLSVSGGVTAYPEGGATEDELIASVVEATRRAREAGGQQVFCNPQTEKETAPS
ncbi:MAG: sensor domain-containing diguanylate cyclase, partial [bacterium]|nr:sensor domain-containing diguanylate cyclase [bacterium]